MQSLNKALQGAWSMSQHCVSWGQGLHRPWFNSRQEMPFPLGAGWGVVEPAGLDWHPAHVCTLLVCAPFLKPS